MTPEEAVAKAAKLVGNPSELARRLEVKPPTVHQWLHGQRPVPPKRASQIEGLTDGAVTRQELCPDFPWDESAARLAAQSAEGADSSHESSQPENAHRGTTC